MYNQKIEEFLEFARENVTRKGDRITDYSLKILNDNKITPLMVAAVLGDDAAVNEILAHSADDVDKANSDGLTPLMMAVKYDHHTIVSTLLHANPDCVNQPDREGKTALMVAASEPDGAKSMQLLLQANAKVNRADDEGKTALMHAASELDRGEHIQLLLDAGASVSQADESGNTSLLHQGAIITDKESWRHKIKKNKTMSLLLKAGSEPCANGNIALKNAICNGESTIAGLLIQNGADINRSYEDGNTPLMLAIDHVMAGVVADLLLNYNPDISKVYENSRGETILMRVEDLLFDCPDEDDSRRIDLLSIFNMLVVKGADIPREYGDSKVSLIRIVKTVINHRRLESESFVHTMLLRLLRHYRKTGHYNEHVDCALRLSVFNNFLGIAKLLLENGADAKISGVFRDESPNMILAMLEGHSSNNAKMANLLLQHGADVNQRGKENKTALMLAARTGDLEFVKVLLNAGANVDLVDDHHETALSYSHLYSGEYSYKTRIKIDKMLLKPYQCKLIAMILVLATAPMSDDIMESILQTSLNGKVLHHYIGHNRKLRFFESPETDNKLTHLLQSMSQGRRFLLNNSEHRHDSKETQEVWDRNFGMTLYSSPQTNCTAEEGQLRLTC